MTVWSGPEGSCSSCACREECIVVEGEVDDSVSVSCREVSSDIHWVIEEGIAVFGGGVMVGRGPCF